jgi:hypothetical protein
MTAEQRVKKIYPKAYARLGLTACIYMTEEGGVINRLLGWSSVRRESWAWADALRHIKESQ